MIGMTVMVARAGGLVTVDGARMIVRKGRSTADFGHPVVAENPEMWEPIRPDFAAPDAPDPVSLAVADALADVLTDAGHDVDPQATIEDMLDQVRMLIDPGAEGADVSEEAASDAAEVDPGTPEGRAEIRRWAVEQGLDVAPTGRLSNDVVDLWRSRNGVK